MRTMSGEEAVELLERAVAKRGESYVYPEGISCAYFYSGIMLYFESSAQCLVGTALAAFGVQARRYIHDHEGYSADGLFRQANYDAEVHGFGITDHTGLVLFSAEAIEVFQEAQSMQDIRHAWGYALTAAKKKLSELRHVQQVEIRKQTFHPQYVIPQPESLKKAALV